MKPEEYEELGRIMARSFFNELPGLNPDHISFDEMQYVKPLTEKQIEFQKELKRLQELTDKC